MYSLSRNYYNKSAARGPEAIINNRRYLVKYLIMRIYIIINYILNYKAVDFSFAKS